MSSDLIHRPIRVPVPDATPAEPRDLRCPACATGRLDPAASVDGVVTCPECGHHAAAAYLAEELWLAEQDRLLHERMAWVEDRVAAGDQPDTGRPAAQLPAGPPAPQREAGRAGHATRPRLTVQTLLLGGGALLLVLAAIVFAAVAWDRLGAAGQIAVLTLLVGALAAAAHALRVSYRSTAEALAAIAAAVAAVALVAAPRLGLGAEWMRDLPATWGAIAFAGLAGLALALAATSGLAAWHVTLVVAPVASVFCAVLAASGGSQVGPLGSAVLAVLGAAVILAHPGRDGRFRREAPWVGAGLGALALVCALAAYDGLDQAVSWAAAWLVIAESAAVLVFPVPGTAPVPRHLSAVAPIVAGAGLGQVLPLLAAGSSIHPWVAAPGLALCGAALLAVSRVRRLAVASIAAAGTLWIVSLPVLRATGELTPVQASAFLAIVAAGLFAASFAPAMGPAGWLAAAAATAAAWLILGDRAIDVLEAYTGSAAALLLAAGLRHAQVSASRSSLRTLGPALAVAALPSAIVAATQARAGEDPLRAVLVILGGTLVALAGVRWRLRAPLLAGLAAATVAGAGQVLALADLVPRWVSLAVAGALLLAGGFAAERLVRLGRRAWEAGRRMR